MKAEQIRTRLRQRPFQPFRLYLRDGRFYEISDPYNNLVLETRLLIGICDNPSDSIPDRIETVQIADIDRFTPDNGTALP
jgi:hypothetical protein